MGDGKAITWVSYAPPVSIKESFLKTGLGTLIERKILLDVKKRFPSVEVVKHSFKMTKERKNQLLSRGLTSNEIVREHSLKKALGLIRKKISPHKLSEIKQRKNTSSKSKLKKTIRKLRR